jgi:hypothetical protein
LLAFYFSGELARHPSADWVVAAREEPGVMRMQTLDPGASATHPTVRSRADVVRRYDRIAFGRIASVSIGDQSGIDFGFSATNGSERLEAADSQDLAFTHQPVTGRHRLSVVEQRCIAKHDRCAGSITDDDIERAAGRPADQLADGSDIVAHVVSVA